VGAFISGGSNACFLRLLAVNARFGYRNRFLERRHGPDILHAYAMAPTSSTFTA
jgi:hypothetical protein